MGVFADAFNKSQETTEDRIGQLMRVAEQAQLKEESDSIFKKATRGSFSFLKGALDIIQRPNFAIATAVKNRIDDDDATTFLGGIGAGLSGKSKDTFSTVLAEAGWNPTTKKGKAARGIAGFGLDIFLDPLTYVTLGAGAGAKIIAKSGKASVLTKPGTKFLKKSIDFFPKESLTKELAGEAMLKMAKKNPELAKAWIDRGGIKMFGQSLVDGDMISKALLGIPGMKTVDRITTPVRNGLGAMFNRNIDPKLGKIPPEFVEFADKIRQAAKSNPEEAAKRVVNIAKANKLTVDEASLITNAIEKGTRMADPRLEHSRKLFERELALMRKSELAKGIQTRELNNYVPHILNKPVDATDVKLSDEVISKLPGTTGPDPSIISGNVIPRGAPGFTKGRVLKKFVDEDGKEQILSTKVFGVRKVPQEQLVKEIDTKTAKLTKFLQDRMETLASPEITRELADTKKLLRTLKKQIDDDVVGLSRKVIDPSKVDANAYAKVIKSIVGPIKRELDTEIAALEKALLADSGKEFLSKPLAVRQAITDARQKKILELNDNIVKAQNDALEKIREIEAFDFVDKTGRKLNLVDSDAGLGRVTAKEINEELGPRISENIIEATAVRAVASEKAKVAKDFFQGARQGFGVRADKAPTNYIASTAKELDGYVFHPAIAKNIDNFKQALINDEASNAFLRTYDDMLNIWKASVTSMFPAFHGRNAISNVLLNFADLGAKVFSPGKNALSASLIIKERKIAKLEQLAVGQGEKAVKAQGQLADILGEIVVKDDFGTEYSMGAIRSLMKQNDIAFRGDRIAEITDKIKVKTGGVVEKIKQANPLSQDFFGYKGGREVGSIIEDHARILNFLTNLDRTGDVMTSAARTKQFLFDYSNLSGFEKNFLKRALPFYTFTRKNLEAQARTIAKTPGRAATQVKAINTIGDLMTDNERLTEEEMAKLPEWMRQGLMITTSRKGSDISFVSNLGLPIEQALSVGPKMGLDMLSPLLKFPLEKTTGREMFRGKDIKDVTNAESFQFAPQVIKDLIGYRQLTRQKRDGTEYTMHIASRPNAMHTLVNIPPVTRIWTILGQLGRKNVPTREKVLQQTTGLKVYEANIEDEAKKREFELLKALEELLVNTKVGSEFSRFFMSDQQKLELEMQQRESNRKQREAN